MTVTAVVKSKTMLAVLVMAFVAQAVVFIIVGRLLAREAAMVAAGADLEEKAQYSVATGKPLIFDGGRVGIVMDTKTGQNGARIAYRVISFVLPEDFELRWAPSPRDVIRKPAAFKPKRVRVRRTRPVPMSAPTRSGREG